MGKRSISDVVVGSDANEDPKLLTKKKKREKAGNLIKNATEKTLELRDNAQDQGPKNDSISEVGKSVNPSKIERKAAKKARKEARKVRRDENTSSEPGHIKSRVIDPVESRNSSDTAKKLARKAEKEGSKRPKDDALGQSALPALLSESDQYQESKELACLPQAEIDTFLNKHAITIEDSKATAHELRPIMSFTYLPISNEAQLAPFAGFKTPTAIQAAAWPFLLSGRDMVGVAETGSGKTLAFGLPCVRFISALPKDKQRKIKAVIVSPTRELAVQIYDQLVVLAASAELRVACVYGGVPKDTQATACRTAHIVVATPGRLNDLICDGAADLSKVEYVVLDEADRMLDKGFEEAIRQIISQTPVKRQTLMFTATWPQSVRELASTFMKTPVRITVGNNASGELRANARIKQLVEVVDPRSKQQRLLQLLKQYQSGKSESDRILVFCLYKKEAVRIEDFVRANGFRVGGIHGDLSQSQRSASLAAFKEGRVPCLVATDVAARGLDIPAVKLVINVTFPLTAEDYVHRIGRTGRAGKEGLAITFFTEHDKALSGSLINVLKAANQPVPEELMKFGTTVKKKGHDAYGAFYKDTETTKKATKITFD